MTSDNCIVQFMIDLGGPITRERRISLKWFGTPPAYMSALARPSSFFCEKPRE
jgi:hypothetical protein